MQTTRLALSDPSRPLVENGAVLDDQRRLPTVVWSPVAPGPFPLVVFVHGYDVGPMTYARFCSTLAAAGYVVAAPSFPLEDPGRGYALDRADLPNEAVDVSFVISAMGTSPLAHELAPGEVEVAGHSDGADVALMTAYQSGRVDPRVRAVFAYAPDPMSGSVAPSNVPLLLVQGDADDVVPYSSSQAVFDQVAAPRYYLTLVGAGHLPPITGGTAWTPVLDGAAAAFLDATVAGRTARSTLPAALAASALVRLQTAG